MLISVIAQKWQKKNVFSDLENWPVSCDDDSLMGVSFCCIYCTVFLARDVNNTKTIKKSPYPAICIHSNHKVTIEINIGQICKNS